jgi:DUF3017 family protein
MVTKQVPQRGFDSADSGAGGGFEWGPSRAGDPLESGEQALIGTESATWESKPVEGPSLPTRRAAFAVVLLLVACSLPATMLFDFRVGGCVLALAAIVGGTARALLPDYLCLGLLVRSRQQDVITLYLLGVAVAVAALNVPGR